MNGRDNAGIPGNTESPENSAQMTGNLMLNEQHFVANATSDSSSSSSTQVTWKTPPVLDNDPAVEEQQSSWSSLFSYITPIFHRTPALSKAARSLQKIDTLALKEKEQLEKTNTDIAILEETLRHHDKDKSKEEVELLNEQIISLKAQKEIQENAFREQQQERIDETARLLEKIAELEQRAVEEKSKQYLQFQQQLREFEEEQQQLVQVQLQQKASLIEKQKQQLQEKEDQLSSLKTDLHLLQTQLRQLQARKAEQERQFEEKVFALNSLSSTLTQEQGKIQIMLSQLASLEAELSTEKERKKQQETKTNEELSHLKDELREKQRLLNDLNKPRDEEILDPFAANGHAHTENAGNRYQAQSDASNYIILPAATSQTPALLAGFFSLNAVIFGALILGSVLAASGPVGWTLLGAGIVGTIASAYRLKKNHDHDQAAFAAAIAQNPAPSSVEQPPTLVDQISRLQNEKIMLQEKIATLENQAGMRDQKEEAQEINQEENLKQKIKQTTLELTKLKKSLEPMEKQQEALQIERDQLAKDKRQLDADRSELEQKSIRIEEEQKELTEQKRALLERRASLPPLNLEPSQAVVDITPAPSFDAPPAPPPPPPSSFFATPPPKLKLNSATPSSSSSSSSSSSRSASDQIDIKNQLLEAVLKRTQKQIDLATMESSIATSSASSKEKAIKADTGMFGNFTRHLNQNRKLVEHDPDWLDDEHNANSKQEVLKSIVVPPTTSRKYTPPTANKAAVTKQSTGTNPSIATSSTLFPPPLVSITQEEETATKVAVKLNSVSELKKRFGGN